LNLVASSSLNLNSPNINIYNGQLNVDYLKGISWYSGYIGINSINGNALLIHTGDGGTSGIGGTIGFYVGGTNFSSGSNIMAINYSGLTINGNIAASTNCSVGNQILCNTLVPYSGTTQNINNTNLNLNSTGTLSLGANTTSYISFISDSFLNDRKIYLRVAPDINHYIGYDGAISNGVMFCGFSGGRLCSSNTTLKTCLTWDANQDVGILNNLTTAGNSTTYGSLLTNTISPHSSATTLTITHTNVSINNFKSNTYGLSYTTIPTLTNTCIGFCYSAQNGATAFTNGVVKNLAAFSLVAGIYSINYSIIYFSTNTGGAGAIASVPMSYGISNSSTSFSSGAACSYFGVDTGFYYPFANYNNSYIMSNTSVINTTVFGSTTVNLNVLIGANGAANSQYIYGWNIQCVRLA
jgi:hypothetical protein